jgi:hypothetical protein
MAWGENFISALRGFIFLQCPAGHAMACGVLSRHQTDTSWRTNGTGVGVGEYDSFTSQLYHGGCLVDFIELRRLGVKRYRGFLPAHVIDEEEEDVGLACEHFGGRTKLGQYRGEQRREERVFHGVFVGNSSAGGNMDTRGWHPTFKIPISKLPNILFPNSFLVEEWCPVPFFHH